MSNEKEWLRNNLIDEEGGRIAFISECMRASEMRGEEKDGD